MRRRVFIPLLLGAAALSGWALFPRPRARSAPADAGPLLVIYSGRDFTGRVLEVTGTLADLPRSTAFDWNDSIRSLRVIRGTSRLCQNGRLNTVLDDTPLADLDLAAKAPARGWSCLVSATSSGPLEIAAPERGGFDEDVSSIELVSHENLPDWAAP